MTLKIEFLQFLEGQKELEEVFIKNLFDYKLSIGKCLLTISWSELGITTVDTLLHIAALNQWMDGKEGRKGGGSVYRTV